jgi:hypothetical protein
MTPERQPKLIHVRRPLKRVEATFEATTPPDGPVTGGPLIPVGRPVRRAELHFEPVAGPAAGDEVPSRAWSEDRFGEAVAWVRRFLVGTSDGRPLSALAVMTREALLAAGERMAALPDDGRGLEMESLRRLYSVLAHVCYETTDAALSPEVFGELKSVLMIWTLGVDLCAHFQHRSPHTQPRLSRDHPVIELLYILSA